MFSLSYTFKVSECLPMSAGLLFQNTFIFTTDATISKGLTLPKNLLNVKIILFFEFLLTVV